MGTNSNGWVEVRTEAGRPYWDGVISVRPIFYRDYAVFGAAFGVRWGGGPEPLAAHRGIPPDASGEVQYDCVPEEGTGQFEHSWVLWSELEHTWLATDTTSLTIGWHALRSLMTVLAGFYGSENVRLVIWFT
jgi:hypothetical protein